MTNTREHYNTLLSMEKYTFKHTKHTLNCQQRGGLHSRYTQTDILLAHLHSHCLHDHIYSIILQFSFFRFHTLILCFQGTFIPRYNPYTCIDKHLKFIIYSEMGTKYSNLFKKDFSPWGDLSHIQANTIKGTYSYIIQYVETILKLHCLML